MSVESLFSQAGLGGVCVSLAIWCSTMAACAQEVILYDFENFGGRQLRLTQSTPDLDPFAFDNDVASIRILSGQWSFHRDDDFQNFNGPPLTLGPGSYPSIAALGFPAERMSSVRLLRFDEGNGDAGDSLTPTPNCPAPYQALGANNQCVFTCGDGTEPNQATGECQCRAGFREIGTDATGRRVCRISTDSPIRGNAPDVTPPIRPPSTGNTGAIPRFPVTPNVTLLPQGEVEHYVVPATEAVRLARQAGFSFLVESRGERNLTGCDVFTRGDRFPRLVVRYALGNEGGVNHLPQTCVFRLFGGRALAPGWAFVQQAEVTPADQCALDHGRARAGEQSGVPGQLITGGVTGNPYPERPLLLAQATVDVNWNTCQRFTWHLREVRLAGPANADWRDAFR